jgi:Ras-related protein Rab-32
MASNNIKNDLKIIIIGSSGTGKTSLTKRWTGQNFEPTKPTIVSEFSTKIVKHGDNLYRVQLWDIGGQDKSPAVTKIFAKDSHGCIIVCDTEEDTLEETSSWKSVVEDESTFTDGGKIPFLLIRNKIDILENDDEKKQIEEETKTFCEENEFIKFFLTSAKDDINVKESIDFFTGHIIQRLEDYLKQGNEDINSMEYRQSVRLTQNGIIPEDEQRAKRGCCLN